MEVGWRLMVRGGPIVGEHHPGPDATATVIATAIAPVIAKSGGRSDRDSARRSYRHSDRQSYRHSCRHISHHRRRHCRRHSRRLLANSVAALPQHGSATTALHNGVRGGLRGGSAEGWSALVPSRRSVRHGRPGSLATGSCSTQAGGDLSITPPAGHRPCQTSSSAPAGARPSA